MFFWTEKSVNFSANLPLNSDGDFFYNKWNKINKIAYLFRGHRWGALMTV